MVLLQRKISLRWSLISKAEASADTILAKLADEVRHSNEEGAHKIAELIEHSIPEELDHAKRLEEAMSACGVEF